MPVVLKFPLPKYVEVLNYNYFHLRSVFFNNYGIRVNITSLYIYISATCFGLTVSHHQALQSIKGIYENTYSKSRSLLQCVYHVYVKYGVRI